MLTIGIAMAGKILLAMRRSLLARVNMQNNLNWKVFILPNLVINGQYELVGSNKSLAEKDIAKLLKENAPLQLNIDDVKKENDTLSVSCHLKGDFQNCDLLAAVVQKHAEVNVKAGENHGVKLSHTNVVRSFLKLPAKEKMDFQISVPAEIASDNLSAGKQNWQLIIYTQRKDDLIITGAAVYNP